MLDKRLVVAVGIGARISVMGKRLVRIVEAQDGKLLPRAWVEAVKRPATKPADLQITALKAEFDVYAEKNQAYRSAGPDWEREFIGEMSNPTRITAHLLSQVPLEPRKKAEMFGLSDEERITHLVDVLRCGV